MMDIKIDKSAKLKVILSVVAISFIQGLQFSLSPVLSQISEHFPNVNISLVQMLITAPAILAMVIALITGVLVLKVTKKKLLIFAGFISGITGFIPFLVDDFNLLFISRIIFGIGLGLACTLNTAVVADFFEGKERISVMGIQAASIGAGMVVITMLSGFLGKIGFEYSYYVNIIGFISMIIIALFLPDKGLEKVSNGSKIKLTRRVFEISFLGFLEFLFLITFTTNISMHLAGPLKGSTSVTGTLTAIFSGSQIVVGIVLGTISKFAKKNTLPLAMLSFVFGAILLILFADNYPILIIAAILCGFSQGIFIPTAMVYTANAVKTEATAMAVAIFTCFMSFGQLVSPTLINLIAIFTLGEFTTINVYIISAIGMLLSSIIAFLICRREK